MKKKIIDKVYQILDDNKAQNIVVIDLKHKSSIADYMVIATGTSSRHIQAISENTAQRLKLFGIDDCRIEGKDSDDWKLIDALEVVIHIFHPEKRSSYNLEKMWEDILCEGRLNKNVENDICNLYIKRISSLKKSGILKVEIKKITSHKNYKIKDNDNVKNFLLDEKGTNLSTLDLAEKIADFNNNRIELINFFLGNPDGFKQNNYKFEKISLSKMTFPHSLARVILCEQIYRCATILSNHPYHRC